MTNRQYNEAEEIVAKLRAIRRFIDCKITINHKEYFSYCGFYGNDFVKVIRAWNDDNIPKECYNENGNYCDIKLSKEFNHKEELVGCESAIVKAIMDYASGLENRFNEL